MKVQDGCLCTILTDEPNKCIQIKYHKMFALILGITILSSIIVLTYIHDHKRKNEILPILCVLVYVLINKLMRTIIEASFIEIILITLTYLSLIALTLRFLLHRKHP